MLQRGEGKIKDQDNEGKKLAAGSCVRHQTSGGAAKSHERMKHGDAGRQGKTKSGKREGGTSVRKRDQPEWSEPTEGAI